MKNRKGLVFALCAMMGAMTFVGCADDNSSSDSESKLELSKLNEMKPGQVQTLTASYEANTLLSASSDDTDCVIVSPSVNTGAENKAEFVVSALGANCSAIITVKANDDVSGVATVKVSASENPYVTLNPGSLDLEVGETDTVNATYRNADGTAIALKGLTLSNSKDSCVMVSSSVETDASGVAKIDVAAVGSDCTSTITVHPSAGGADVTFTARVAAGEVVSGTPKLEFQQNSMSISPDNKDGVNITIRYTEDNKGVSGKKVTVVSSDQSCVYYKEGQTKSDSDGNVGGTLIPKGSECTATITASAGSAKAEMTVTVTNKTIFTLRGINVKAENKHEKMGYVGVEFSNVPCSEVENDLESHTDFTYSKVQPAGNDGTAPLVHKFTPDECEASGCFEEIDASSVKSFVAFAAASGQNDKEIVGYGCKDTDVSMDNSVIDIALKPMPVNIKGTYDTISNFDLTSAFPATSSTLPAVEKMGAGDWIKFLADLFGKPVDTLYDFLWTNSVSRLTQIPGISDLEVLGFNVGDLINGLVNSDTTKKLGLAYVKPLLQDYLGAGTVEECKKKFPDDEEKQQDCMKDTWYDILLRVSPDVEDLVRNMQLAGKMVISSVNGTNITEATDSYTELQYQWSYKGKNCLKPLNNAYAKEGKSRCVMSLNSTKYQAIEGSWGGFYIEDGHTSAGDADLTINAHSLTFKWATILYAAVFNTILPTALSYNAMEDKPLTAFMTKLLFEPIVTKYRTDYNTWSVYKDGDKKTQPDFSSTCSEKFVCEKEVDGEGNPKTDADGNYICVKDTNGDDKGKTYPCLAIASQADYGGDANNYKCGQFIEALIYMIAGDNNLKKVIPTAAELICDKGLGALDDEVWKQLGKIEASTSNGFMLSSNSCALYDGNTTNYTKMGMEDDMRWSANDVVGTSKKETNRCSWDLAISADTHMKGIFHATRED